MNYQTYQTLPALEVKDGIRFCIKDALKCVAYFELFQHSSESVFKSVHDARKRHESERNARIVANFSRFWFNAA